MQDHYKLSLIVTSFFIIIASPESVFSTVLVNEQLLYDLIRTDVEYYSLLNASDEDILTCEFETEFLLLLDEEEIEEYGGLTDLNARKEFIKKYWQLRNPNPVFPQKDRLLVHIRIRAYARKNFPTDSPPYFDDRASTTLNTANPGFPIEILAAKDRCGGV